MGFQGVSLELSSQSIAVRVGDIGECFTPMQDMQTLFSVQLSRLFFPHTPADLTVFFPALIWCSRKSCLAAPWGGDALCIFSGVSDSV